MSSNRYNVCISFKDNFDVRYIQEGGKRTKVRKIYHVKFQTHGSMKQPQIYEEARQLFRDRYEEDAEYDMRANDMLAMIERLELHNENYEKANSVSDGSVIVGTYEEVTDEDEDY